MYNIEIDKVLKNGLKTKTMPSFERGEHVEYKYILKMIFDFSEMPKKGAKPLNDLYMTSEVI